MSDWKDCRLTARDMSVKSSGDLFDFDLDNLSIGNTMKYIEQIL